MYQDMLPTTTLTLTMILQDPGDNEGLCPLMILIKALSITVYVCSFLTMVEFRLKNACLTGICAV